MRDFHAYTDAAIEQVLHEEGWDRPLPPVERQRPTGWYRLAFWGLQLYIVVMLAAVAVSFIKGVS